MGGKRLPERTIGYAKLERSPTATCPTCRAVACASCRLGPKCTRNAAGRPITRWVDEAILEAMAERVRAHPDKVKLRKYLVEHPFRTNNATGTRGSS